MIKLGSSSLIIRNKKSGQSMHALTKTKVSEATLTNLHNSQLLRKCYIVATVGENPGYLQMVILPHIAFVCFSFLFNNVVEKGLEKKCVIGERKYSSNSRRKFA